MAKPKEGILMIRGLTRQDKKRIKDQARDEGVKTMSALVRKVLFNYLKEKGAESNG